MGAMEPSEKSLEIGMTLEAISGRTSSIHDNKCINPPLGCGRHITEEEMAGWDALTRKEYTISGWCNECQDKVFGTEEE